MVYNRLLTTYWVWSKHKLNGWSLNISSPFCHDSSTVTCHGSATVHHYMSFTFFWWTACTHIRGGHRVELTGWVKSAVDGMHRSLDRQADTTVPSHSLWDQGVQVRDARVRSGMGSWPELGQTTPWVSSGSSSGHQNQQNGQQSGLGFTLSWVEGKPGHDWTTPWTTLKAQRLAKPRNTKRFGIWSTSRMTVQFPIQ